MLKKNDSLLKNRLQYFATGTQNYIKELRNTIVNNDDSQEVNK